MHEAGTYLAGRDGATENRGRRQESAETNSQSLNAGATGGDLPKARITRDEEVATIEHAANISVSRTSNKAEFDYAEVRSATFMRMNALSCGL